jgi:transcription termination factor Rho
MLRIESLNGLDVDAAMQRGEFDSLKAQYPDERLRLESKSGGLAMRVVDLFAPIGKGQRGLIVAPPRAGKTILLQQMANSIAENHPEVFVIMLLIDERPEEVTDMRANCPTAEVISSTFDEPASRHVMVTDMVGEKARRLVEAGRDVVILLDSITRMARAHNTVLPNTGRIMSGGVDAQAMAKPNRFFGAARRIADGGSLTIIGTALIDTGSRMDEVIFEEFKGKGNMELVLSRDLANARVFPAIDIFKSGTRKEELLLSQEEMNRTLLLRTYLSAMPEEDVMPFLLRQMSHTSTNKEFFRAMAEGGA